MCTTLGFLSACGGDEHEKVSTPPPKVLPNSSQPNASASSSTVPSTTTTTTVDPALYNFLKAHSDWNRLQEHYRQQRVKRAKPPVTYSGGSYPCGGDYPPCYVAQRESGNSYNAFNPTGCGGSGCYGRWQFSGEWACRLGLPCDLSTATPQQQDEAARILWAQGRGCSNWAAC